MRTMSSKSENHQLFEQIYKRYSGRVYSYAMQLTKGDTYLSEEIVQIVFIQLWEHFTTLKDRERVLSYLFTTAKNTFLNFCEHETIEFIYADYVLAHSQETDNHAEELQNANSLEKYLHELVSKMPPVRQRVFVMSRYQHMMNKEIAKQLGISEKTVEVHITLALKELKEKLND